MFLDVANRRQQRRQAIISLCLCNIQLLLSKLELYRVRASSSYTECLLITTMEYVNHHPEFLMLSSHLATGDFHAIY